MTRLIIHQPVNFESRKYRYYNIFFDDLIKEIREGFDVLENRYYKYANSKRYPIKLLFDDTSDAQTTELLECEMLIENYDTKEFCILSVSDDLTPAILNMQSNPLLKKVLVSQFYQKKLYSHIKEENLPKYSPWIYFPSNYHDLELYRNQRLQEKDLIDKMYFSGSNLEIRKILNYFNPDNFDGGRSIGGFDRYASKLIKYKVGFSTAGRGEFCYRDIEYMAMGIPFIRFKYESRLEPNLIPNVHYISVDRPDDNTNEHTYGATHAKLIEEKFNSIRNDKEFLGKIATNAYGYYMMYLSPQSSVHHTTDLLQLDQWK